MKKLTLVLAIGALAACKQTAPAPSESTAPTPAATSTALTMADRAGTYSYDDGKGASGTSVLNPDGQYTDTSTDGKDIETGTWSVDGAGRVCFDPKGDDPKQPNRCYVMSEAGADGTMTATGENGEAVKVKKTG